MTRAMTRAEWKAAHHTFRSTPTWNGDLHAYYTEARRLYGASGWNRIGYPSGRAHWVADHVVPSGNSTGPRKGARLP